MKIFRTDAENQEMESPEELQENIEILESMLKELRHIIGQRRTLLKNADKKLQEFQDTIYAMIMEEEYPQKWMASLPDEDDEEPDSFSF